MAAMERRVVSRVKECVWVCLLPDVDSSPKPWSILLPSPTHIHTLQAQL
jgi:hypothetical protein